MTSTRIPEEEKNERAGNRSAFVKVVQKKGEYNFLFNKAKTRSQRKHSSMSLSIVGSSSGKLQPYSETLPDISTVRHHISENPVMSSASRKLKGHKLRVEMFYELLQEKNDDELALSYDCQKNLVLPKIPDQAAYYNQPFYELECGEAKSLAKRGKSFNNARIPDVPTSIEIKLAKLKDQTGGAEEEDYLYNLEMNPEDDPDIVV
ncbi:hypothetical protein PR048_011978 [Dryococelus australis]|uniref:Uncharacterized protein n=1 Tax=Dryococelus australis TaxID=614101 RepID=A0ABQ9HN47_9NEOP|nr:hypothetical protein PR048_011978 [Dryococelus australis]